MKVPSPIIIINHHYHLQFFNWSLKLHCNALSEAPKPLATASHVYPHMELISMKLAFHSF